MAGRPLKFATVKELQDKIDAYFHEIDDSEYVDANGIKHREPLTITGLAMALDTTRETLLDYEKRGEYSDTISKAKTKIENYAEKQVFVGRNQTGAIFALKNYGWKDTQETTNANLNLNKTTENVDEKDMELLERFFKNKGKE